MQAAAAAAANYICMYVYGPKEAGKQAKKVFLLLLFATYVQWL